MIQALNITNHLQNTLSLNLRTSDVEEGLLVFSMEGLGSPDGSVDGVSGPNIDGFVRTSMRHEARYINLTLAIVPGADSDVVRAKIHAFFPTKRNVNFRVTTDTKDVYVDAVVESVVMNSFSKVENAEITLVCAWPYFIDWVEKNVEITQSTLPLTYDGEVDTGGVFSIDFTDDVPLTTLTLVNDQYDQEMVLDFTDVLLTVPGADYMLSGDAVILDTRVGLKSALYVRGGQSYNMLSGVGFDDDWIRLGHDDNVINILDWWLGSGPTSDVEVFLDYKELYQGV